MTEELTIPMLGGPLIAPFQAGDPIIKKVIQHLATKFPKSVIQQIRNTKPLLEQLDDAYFMQEHFRRTSSLPRTSKGFGMGKWANQKLVEALEEGVALMDQIGP